MARRAWRPSVDVCRAKHVLHQSPMPLLLEEGGKLCSGYGTLMMQPRTLVAANHATSQHQQLLIQHPTAMHDGETALAAAVRPIQMTRLMTKTTIPYNIHFGQSWVLQTCLCHPSLLAYNTY